MSKKEIKEGERAIAPYERECLNKECTEYILQRCFLPLSDPFLFRAGVDVCAKLEVRRGKVEEKIEFESPEGTAGLLLERTVYPQAILDPEGDYIDLRLGISRLIDRGIAKTLHEAIRMEVAEGKIITDISKSLRRDILNALAHVAPEETKVITLNALSILAVKFPSDFGELSSNFDKVICDHFTADDFRMLDEIEGGIENLTEEIKSCLRDNPRVPRDLRDKLL